MTARVAGGPDNPGSMESDPPGVDVLVATYNSAETLEESLDSARRYLPVHHLIVVDRSSTDGTLEIAQRYGARILRDDVGLGSARNRALEAADTEPVLFLDSDVRILRPDFYPRAREAYARAGTAAVVGMSVGHSFRYGLPLGLTLIGRARSLAAGIPDAAQGRETYYLQQQLRRSGHTVRYVPEAMVHRGTYRRSPHWPEFQGASIRLASGWNPREVVYAALVTLLMHMNSKRPRNVLYSPIFYGKLLRGFFRPAAWANLSRAPSGPTAGVAGEGLPP